MPSKKQTIKAVLINVLEICSAIVIALVLVAIASNQISGIVSSINQSKEISLEGQANSVAMSLLQSQIATINGNDTKIGNALLHEDDIIPFINELQSLASKSSVQQSYEFSSPQSYASQGNLTVYSINYSINLAGNLSGFENYLSDFQALPYFTNISSVNISAPSGPQSSATMAISATLYVEQ